MAMARDASTRWGGAAEEVEVEVEEEEEEEDKDEEEVEGADPVVVGVEDARP